MLTIRPEHAEAWESVAAKNGAESAEAFAQERLDELGEAYEAARQWHVRTGQARFSELARKLPEEEMLALTEQVRTRVADLGLIPAE